MDTNSGPAAMLTLRAVTVQQLIDTITGKPGSTLEDVTAALQLIAAGGDPATLAALINAAVGGLQTGASIDAAQAQALIDAATQGMVTEQFLMDNVGPAIQQAIASASGKASDRLTLNLTTPGNGAFVIETNNLTGAQYLVGVDFRTQRGGEVTVNGKRVLTVDDALAAGGAGIDQAAVEAAVAAATAPLLARIEALEAEAKKFVYLEYMEEQFGNFNELLSADIGGVTQLALAEQVKLQRVIDLLGGDQTVGSTTVEQAVAVFTGLNTIISENIVAPAVEAVQNKLMAYMNALAGKTDPTPTEVRRALDEIAEYAQQIEQYFNQMIAEVVDYVATEYSTKAEFAALNTELEGFANEAVPAMVQSELENRIPTILDALQTHLENVLAIFGGGGTTGVTPAQITELTAEFARVYATKEQVAAHAKTTDTEQIITAKSIILDGIKFNGSNEALTPISDEYGNRLRLIPPDWNDPNEFPIVVTHTDIRELLDGGRMGMTEEERVEARREEVVTLMTGGIPVPPNLDWTEVEKTGTGTGKVEFRCINGVVQWRGQFAATISAVGSYTKKLQIPAAFAQYKPAVESNFSAFAVDTGTAYRFASVRIGPDGSVGLSAPTGKYDTMTFGGISYPVF